MSGIWKVRRKTTRYKLQLPLTLQRQPTQAASARPDKEVIGACFCTGYIQVDVLLAAITSMLCSATYKGCKTRLCSIDCKLPPRLYYSDWPHGASNAQTSYRSLSRICTQCSAMILSSPILWVKSTFLLWILQIPLAPGTRSVWPLPSTSTRSSMYLPYAHSILPSCGPCPKCAP